MNHTSFKGHAFLQVGGGSIVGGFLGNLRTDPKPSPMKASRRALLLGGSVRGTGAVIFEAV